MIDLKPYYDAISDLKMAEVGLDQFQAIEATVDTLLAQNRALTEQLRIYKQED